MARNISDQMGRALEYAITDYILSHIKDIRVNESTIRDQQRDLAKFLALSNIEQAHFMLSSKRIFEWLSENHQFERADTLFLERLPDSDAKKGDVTDIRITLDESSINLSIKHNHTALKHQRPGALPQQCDFKRKSPIDIVYRTKYAKIITDFISEANDQVPEATLFKELKNTQVDFIDKNLYLPICELVTSFLNEYSSASIKSQYFFKFLVGRTDFLKLVVYPDRINILKFADMPTVKSLEARTISDSYIQVCFSNGWVILMRLHTASSRIAGVSLKFDTQPSNIDVDSEIITL